MNKFFTRIFSLLLLCSLGLGEILAQPWTYDFGTGTGTATNANSGSGNTGFFTSTPSGGGTYRVRIGSGNGNLILANPGTSLGSGTEAQLTATTGGSSNKFTVYGWNSPTTKAYVKFKLRTTSTGNGELVFHLGNGSASTLFTDNNGYTNYNNSITTLKINYSSGAISSVQRRISGSFLDISGHGFAKNTDQVVEIYANNTNAATTYSRSGTQSLGANSWDMWVDGTKISPSGGWAKPGTWATGNNIAGFGFFGESSTSNAAVMYLDDLEYSNSLPVGCSAPDETPVGFEYSDATENTIDLVWVNGDGAGRVIVMNAVNSFTDLDDEDDPTANLAYSGSGEQVIYNSDSTFEGPITVTGLLPNTTYYFKGYEYCDPDRVYNNSGDVESVTTDVGSNIILTDAASFGPFCNGSANVISVGFDETGTFNEDFKVQISDASGNFPPNTSSNIIGAGGTSPISATIPADYTVGTGYRVRVINADPVTISGDDNGSDVVITATPGLPAATTPAAVCEGNAVVITATGSANATGYTFWDEATGGNEITSGISGNTLTVTPGAGTYSYFIQGENGSCVSTRQEVVVTIYAVPDEPTGTFSYSANPSCGPASIGYDAGYYFQASAGGTSTAFPTSSSYTLNSSGTVYVRAYNGNCWSGAVASNAVSVTNPVNITSQPVNISVAQNGTGAFSVTATGVTGYQWQENNGVSWSPVGTNSSSLSVSNPPAIKNGYQYRVLLTANAPCTDVYSNVVTLTVTAPLAESIWSNPITGASAGITSPYKTGQDTASNMTYSGLLMTGATKTAANDRFNTNNWELTLNTGKYFSWILTPQSGYELDLEKLEVTTQASGTGPTNLVVRTSKDGFASNVYSSNQVVNQTRTHNISFTGITGQTNSVEVRIYAYGTSNTGGTFSINDFDFDGIIKPACSVDDPSGTFSYSANPSCGPATIGYTTGYYFQTLADGTSTTHPTSAPYVLNSSGTVYVRAYNGTCWSDAVASNAVVVNSPVSVSNQPQNRTVSSTGSGTMSVTASNVSSYQWQENDGSGWNNISGATNSTLIFNHPSQSKNGFTYRVVMSANAPCDSDTSSVATLTVITPSGPCSTPSGLSANVVGNQVTFSWSGTSGADIHAVLLKNEATEQYANAYSIINSGTTVTVPSGTYTWMVKSLCNTAIFVADNASEWISGTQFTVP